MKKWALPGVKFLNKKGNMKRCIRKNKKFGNIIYIIMLLPVFLIGSLSNSSLLAGGEGELKSFSDTMARAQDYYLKGKEFILKGEYQKANEAFQKAEEILSRSFQKSNSSKNLPPLSVEQAESEGGKTKQREGGNILERAKKAFKENKLDEALGLYKRALNIYPKSYDIHYNLGVIYLKQRNYLNAAKEFQTVVSLNRDDADAYYNLGVIYENFLNDKTQAIRYYKKYLRCSRSDREKKLVKSWIDYIKREIRR